MIGPRYLSLTAARADEPVATDYCRLPREPCFIHTVHHHDLGDADVIVGCVKGSVHSLLITKITAND